MKLILAHILFFLGDKIGFLLKFEWSGSRVYPLYNWLMTKSCDLDANEKIWKTTIKGKR